MASSGGGPLEFHNIQEILDIELMFELICMFFFCLFILITNDQKRENQQENRRKYNIITILYSSKTHVNSSLLFDQFISNIQEIIDIEWLFELISIFFIYLYLSISLSY